MKKFGGSSLKTEVKSVSVLTDALNMALKVQIKAGRGEHLFLRTKKEKESLDKFQGCKTEGAGDGISKVIAEEVELGKAESIGCGLERDEKIWNMHYRKWGYYKQPLQVCAFFHIFPLLGRHFPPCVSFVHLRSWFAFRIIESGVIS